MKFHIFLIILVTTSVCECQNIKIYSEDLNNGINIYADNYEHYPVSLQIKYNLNNLQFITLKKDSTNTRLYILEGGKQRQFLGSFDIIDKRYWGEYISNAWVYYGNVDLKEYDTNYVYNLPFLNEGSFKCYGGNENALNFGMPVGTEVTAVREGIVVRVVDSNSISHPTLDCIDCANFITIYHPDGTFAEYFHIKQSSTIVNVGDKVEKGQVIGYSGDTGFAMRPHLHLIIFLQKLGYREMLKTKFRTGNGDKEEYLVEGEIYSRNY